jgi:D-alanyl-lipoteichoic acid acyltransferase DltB (MBOAT superfamily)
MLFNSLQFLLFLPTVVAVYFIIPFKKRWLWLLISSYFFYMCWSPGYALLILTSTVITYFSGIGIEKINNSTKIKNKVKNKKICVTISFISNLSILIFFKYYNFIGENLGLLFSNATDGNTFNHLDILLPVGISFYTFQALSYTMDIYRGNLNAEHHFGKYALFVSFFPQLVAGPIERSSNLLPQFRKKINFNFKNLWEGSFIILCGLFKKVVIADRLAVTVNIIYDDPTKYSGYPLIIATLFFTFQIYCDFSAYSDIAIGSAKIMGFDLMENFNKPYFSKSISEFWRKWHISLSTWFRDYLYFPLGGNKVSKIKRYRNILIVFITSGMWHGASWNFIIWGALHGVYLIFELLLKPFKIFVIQTLKIKPKSFGFKLFQISFTFSLVSFAWIFFRANTLSDAIYISKNIFFLDSFKIMNTGLSPFDFTLSKYLILFLILIQFIQRKINLKEKIYNENLLIRWLFFSILILVIIFWGYYPTEATQFIYFQF